MSDELKREDYEEPQCLLKMDKGEERPINAVPIRRVIEKLDEYLTKNDQAAAERHIKYWIGEAVAGRDNGALLSLTSELMGFYRNNGRPEEAEKAAERGLELMKAHGFEGTVTGATTLLNAATAYKYVGKPETAVKLYSQAKEIYEKHLKDDDYRLGGLYNNMALALVDINRFAEAYGLYGKAVEVMKKCGGCEPEQAVTCLNAANAVEAEKGLEDGAEEINGYLERAQELMEAASRDKKQYYAYYCDKCAPTFAYYGWFAYAEELKKRSEDFR